ncbi:hypothetical protein Tsubulata_000152 [Turnera subulata]|uniref:Non-specific lipid-transfer protein n=1 Tax=Turnera subulata TaxID=218843 RepID=A0A9Q0J9H0_9ROSI|nr:hypothetical protein Tsubulata_000152 [Turnera subulata]
MANLKLVCALLLVCIVVSAPMTAQAVTCSQVARDLVPCIGYLQGRGAPTAGCCNGVRALAGAAKTTADRRTACTCLKNAAAGVKGLNPSFAAALPGACGHQLRVDFFMEPELFRFQDSRYCNARRIKWVHFVPRRDLELAVSPL